jgi:type IV pilus assembly protein PilX
MKQVVKKSQRAMQSQQGVVLVVALIMVLLMSIVGMASIRGSGLQESMVANMRDKNVAFQAAEAGLRAGEADLSGVSFNPNFDDTKKGYWKDLTLTGAKYAPVSTWTASQWEERSIQVDLDIDNLESQPRYIIEKLEYELTAKDTGGAVDVGSAVTTDQRNVFRVTSRSTGWTEDSFVVLQSTYVREAL